MINYTERLALLMRDIVFRVPTLSFIDMSEVLVFARFGRCGSAGPVATCHCLNLPPSDPGCYFWRDRATGTMTRRSEWFISRSPIVTIGDHQIKYLISFTLPRFCNQTLRRSRKEQFYRNATDDWMTKLDTVVHELYHIDPDHQGIRRLDRGDGTCSPDAHGPKFFAEVARMVSEYLDTRPDPETYAFLADDFDALEAQHGGVAGTCFGPFPSYPQRFLERLEPQPVSEDASLAGLDVEPWRAAPRRTLYTTEHLHIRQFFHHRSRQADRRRQIRAA
jgi:hypothetical protein